MKSCSLDKCLVCLLALLMNANAGRAQPPPAQGQPQRLLVDYVSPSLLQTNANSSTSVPQKLFPSNSTNQTIANPPARLSKGDRWEKFEAEFGIKEKDSSFVKGTIESAKYKLDETVFAAKEFVDTLRYDGYLKDFVGGSDSNAPRRYYSDPVRDAWENAEIRSGVDWDAQSRRAFVGIRLVLPLGD